MKKSNISDDRIDCLCDAILAIKTKEECRDFFRDLCTLSELKSMSERLQVAKELMDKVPYREIAKKIGSSTATITRVADWLNNGTGGYKKILERL